LKKIGSIIFIIFLFTFAGSCKPEVLERLADIPKYQALDYTPNYQLESFEVKDLLRNTFNMTIKANNNLEKNALIEIQAKEKEGKLIKRTIYHFDLWIDGVSTGVVEGTLDKRIEKKISVDIYGAEQILAGEHKVNLYYYPINMETGEFSDPVLMDTKSFIMPERLQITPTIHSISPTAGIEGELITFRGKNFGENPQAINIYISDSRPERTYPSFGEKELAVLKAQFVSLADTEGFQEIRFIVPSDIVKKIDNGKFLRNKVKFRMLVNYSLASPESNSASEFDLLHPRWKKIMFFSSIMAMLLFLGFIPLLTKKWNFIPYMLIDKQTNTYSLSRFQAFLWTVTLFGSYLYVAICYGILKDNEIPDFNVTLLGLMGISYGSLISSTHLARSNPKNELKERNPRFADLITSNGSIDITRFQMFGFTILTIGLYIFNLYNADILQGMPEIPATLHGLLLSSQAGYLGGKVTGDKIVVNQVIPNKIKITDAKDEITIVGNGFSDGIKIMLEGREPIRAKFIDPTTIKFSPKSFVSDGKKSLLLIPPVGATVEIADALEVLPKNFSPEQEDTKG
jgi:hypothetical protein